jgi:hypothetical protein
MAAFSDVKNSENTSPPSPWINSYTSTLNTPLDSPHPHTAFLVPLSPKPFIQPHHVSPSSLLHYLPYLTINTLFLYVGYPNIIDLSMNWVPLSGITENKQYFCPLRACTW